VVACERRPRAAGLARAATQEALHFRKMSRTSGWIHAVLREMPAGHLLDEDHKLDGHQGIIPSSFKVGRPDLGDIQLAELGDLLDDIAIDLVQRNPNRPDSFYGFPR